MDTIVKSRVSSSAGSFWNLMKLDFNIFWGNKLYILSLFAFPFGIGIINVIMIPVFAGSWTYFLTTTIPSLLVFVNMKYGFRKSGLQDNNNLTKNSTLVFYLEAFVSYLLIFTMFTLSYLAMFKIYGNVLGIFRISFGGTTYDSIYLKGVPWLNLSFFIFYYSLLNFSFYLIVSRFIDDKKFFIMIILSLVIISIPCGGLANQEIRGGWTQKYGEVYINSSATSPSHIFTWVKVVSDCFTFKNGGEEMLGIYYNVYIQKSETYLTVLNDMAFVFFPWNGLGQFFTVGVIESMVAHQQSTVLDTNVVHPLTVIDFSDEEWWFGMEGAYNAWRFSSPNMLAPYMFKSENANNLRLIMFIVYPLIHIFFYNVVAFADKLHKKFRRI